MKMDQNRGGIRKDKYRIVVENLPLGMSLIDSNGNYIFVNSKFVEIFGYTLEDVSTGREWFAKAYPDKEYRKRVISTWVSDLEELKCGETGLRICNVRCKDGSKKTIRFRLVKLDNRERLVFYEDIAECEERQKTLKEKERKLDNILKFSPYAITVTDLKGIIIECNQATLDLHGFSSEEEVIGKSAYELIAPKARKKAARNMGKTLENGYVKNVEYVFLTKEGKEFPAELSASVIKNSLGRPELFVAITKDISARKEKEKELFYLATHDTLTGVYNRDMFRSHLGLAQNRAQRNRSGFCVMMLDLDKFKEVNDTLGHRIGDKLLQLVARRIREALRKQDSIARMGGDEFLVLLPEVNRRANVNVVAEKVLNLFEVPFRVKDHVLEITTSIGIAIYPDHGKDRDSLIQCADIAMYQAKARGRNNYQYYHN